MTERETNIRPMLDIVPLAAYLFTCADQRFFAANALFCDLVGYSEQELLSLPWHYVVEPGELAAASLAAHVEDAINSANTSIFPTEDSRWTFRHKDGVNVRGTAKIRELRIVKNDGAVVPAQLVVVTA